jgi:hypothetical protein
MALLDLMGRRVEWHDPSIIMGAISTGTIVGVLPDGRVIIKHRRFANTQFSLITTNLCQGDDGWRLVARRDREVGR